MTAPLSARARVRAELTAEIVAAAGQELSEVGPAALSLRAVARRLGMVPSALYRYFPSRDSLLTELIIEAYESVGDAAAGAAAATAGAPSLDRWLAVCAAVRRWGQDHPHQWALIYGSPVPGYAAPQMTVDAALRISEVVASIIPENPPGRRKPAVTGVYPPAGQLDPILAPMRDLLFPGRRAEVVIGALMAWTSLIGMVGLELFGHYKGATTDFDPVFTYSMEVAGRLVGLA